MPTLTLSPAVREAAAARLAAAGRLVRPSAPEPAQPVAASPQKLSAGESHQARALALLADLRERYPAAFRTPPVPLAIGTDHALREALSGSGYGDEVRSTALAIWCSQPEYHRAVAAGGPRYALDGTVAGEVSESQAEHARRRLEKAVPLHAAQPEAA